jgi:GntR family transcriptional regulator
MTDDVLQPLKTNKLSLATQAQRYLGSLIHNGTYQPGDQLPSQADLAAQLGISRATLREALLNLEQDGLIIRRHGVGTFIAPGCEDRLESGLECLESILELAARQGLKVSINALDVREVRADADIAERLQLAPGTQLTSVRRVIQVGRRPVAYMVDVAPASILCLVEVDQAFRGSVLDLLRQKSTQLVTQAIAEITALSADAFLAEKLHVAPGQPIVLIEELLFDQQGVAVEFSRNYFLPEFFRFHVLRS